MPVYLDDKSPASGCRCREPILWVSSIPRERTVDGPQFVGDRPPVGRERTNVNHRLRDTRRCWSVLPRKFPIRSCFTSALIDAHSGYLEIKGLSGLPSDFSLHACSYLKRPSCLCGLLSVKSPASWPSCEHGIQSLMFFNYSRDRDGLDRQARLALLDGRS